MSSEDVMTPASAHRSPPSSRLRKHVAFSLVELLVVLLIVAVLASMLFPTIRMVREAALGVKCAGNLRQVGIASDCYAGDWDGAVVPSGFKVGGQAWYQNLATYLEESATINDPRVGRILRGCPGFRSGSYQSLTSGSWQWQQYNGYAETLYLANPSGLPQNAAGVYTRGCTYYDPTTPTYGANLFNPLLSVGRRSSRPFVFDHYGQYYNFLYYSTDPVKFQRHGRLANSLFFDWHVAASDLKTLQGGSYLY